MNGIQEVAAKAALSVVETAIDMTMDKREKEEPPNKDFADGIIIGAYGAATAVLEQALKLDNENARPLLAVVEEVMKMVGSRA